MDVSNEAITVEAASEQGYSTIQLGEAFLKPTRTEFGAGYDGPASVTRDHVDLLEECLMTRLKFPHRPPEIVEMYVWLYT